LYEKFEKLLIERNVTAYQVAQKTGVATSTLTEWKKGTYTPKIDKIMLIARYFNVPIEYFLEDKETT
jgi:transcriptional regulator with XRE-family HTH domain